MLMLLQFLAFGGGTALAGYAIAVTVMPRMDQIGAALTGRVPQDVVPARGGVAQQRTIVRHWSAAPRAAVQPTRAAA